MKYFFLAFSLYSSLCLNAQAFKKVFNMTTTADYCGGAAPPEDLLKELATQKPDANKIFYLIKGSKNKKGIKIIQRLVTNKQGVIEVVLPIGNYGLLNETQIKPLKKPIINASESWDVACLKQNWEIPQFKFVVKDTNIFNFNRHETCPYNKPCLTFKGALPN